MDLNSTDRALTRARKRLAHAVRQHGEATSERARKRHARRIRNARQLEADARWTWEHLALSDPE